MTFQMANYDKHTRSLSVCGVAVAVQCLDRTTAAVTCLWEWRVCVHTWVCAVVFIGVPVCFLKSHEGYRTSAQRELLLMMMMIVVKVIQRSNALWQLFVEQRLISMPVCQVCFTRSLWLLVDLFQQTANTTAALSLPPCTCDVVPANPWVWDRNKRENTLCNDWISFLCKSSPCMLLLKRPVQVCAISVIIEQKKSAGERIGRCCRLTRGACTLNVGGKLENTLYGTIQFTSTEFSSIQFKSFLFRQHV